MTDGAQTRRSALQQRVADAIIDSAAHVFAIGGAETNMNEIAETAGVGRATLYRYFPNRHALLVEVADVAAGAVGERLAAARLDGVSVEEGVRRAARALVDVGDYFIVLARRQMQAGPDRLMPTLSAPLRAMFERGQSTGSIRADLSSAWLADALVSLVVSTLSEQPALGPDDTVAAITTFFLDGCRARNNDSRPEVTTASRGE